MSKQADSDKEDQIRALADFDQVYGELELSKTPLEMERQCRDIRRWPSETLDELERLRAVVAALEEACQSALNYLEESFGADQAVYTKRALKKSIRSKALK